MSPSDQDTAFQDTAFQDTAFQDTAERHAADQHSAGSTDVGDDGLWDPVPNSEPESRHPVSLGPLALLGFGPQPDSGPTSSGRTKPSVLVTLAAVVILIAGLKVARPVLLPLVVSAFVATLLAPAVLYLKQKRVPEVIGVPVVVALALAVFAGVTGLVVGSLNAFIRALPAYQQDLIALVVTSSERLEKLGIRVEPAELYDLVQPGAVMTFAGQTLSGIADFFSTAVLLLLLTVFVLFEVIVLPSKIRRALGDPDADLSQGLRVIQRVKAYVVVKTNTSLATGLIITAALELVGVDFAFMWGMLAFLLNFIPNIGSIIAAIPAMALALLQLGWTGALVTALIFLLVNIVIGSFLEPRIMGRRMNLSPLIVFMSLLFWGWLWGPLGMLLSVPLTMVVRILLEGSPETRPLAILMAGATEAPLKGSGTTPIP